MGRTSNSCRSVGHLLSSSSSSSLTKRRHHSRKRLYEIERTGKLEQSSGAHQSKNMDKLKEHRNSTISLDPLVGLVCGRAAQSTTLDNFLFSHDRNSFYSLSVVRIRPGQARNPSRAFSLVLANLRRSPNFGLVSFSIARILPRTHATLKGTNWGDNAKRVEKPLK